MIRKYPIFCWRDGAAAPGPPDLQVAGGLAPGDLNITRQVHHVACRCHQGALNVGRWRKERSEWRRDGRCEEEEEEDRGMKAESKYPKFTVLTGREGSI